MIGLLGDIVLENVEVTSREEDYGGEFAEHARIGLKPLLQPTGESLEELRLTFELHIETADPDARLGQLQALRAGQQAAPLVFAGVYRGYFVLASLGVIFKLLDDIGNVIHQTVSVTLREYAGDIVAAKKTPGIANGNDPVSTQLTPPSNETLPADTTPAIHRSLKAAVAASNQVNESVATNIDALAVLQELKDEDAQAAALNQVQSLFDKSKSLAQKGVDAITTLANGYNSVMSSVDQFKASQAAIHSAADVLKPPFDISTLPDRIALAQGQLGNAQSLIKYAAGPLTSLTALSAVRSPL